MSRKRKSLSAHLSVRAEAIISRCHSAWPSRRKAFFSSRTPDTCRPGNGCVPRRFLLVSFRSALRSPFTSSARTAVPLSAAPCAVLSKKLLFSFAGLKAGYSPFVPLSIYRIVFPVYSAGHTLCFTVRDMQSRSPRRSGRRSRCQPPRCRPGGSRRGRRRRPLPRRTVRGSPCPRC